MIISNPELGFRLGVRSQSPLLLFNGALECKLLRFNIEEKLFSNPKPERSRSVSSKSVAAVLAAEADNQPACLQIACEKNMKKTGKMGKTKITFHCYRLYDADLPEYAVAVDVYQGTKPGSMFRNTNLRKV